MTTFEMFLSWLIALPLAYCLFRALSREDVKR